MMLKDKDIVCISFPNWEGEYMKTIVQIMTVFGRYNRVFYVDYEFTWKDILFYFLRKRDLPISRVLGFTNRIRNEEIGEGKFVYIFTPPPVLPINWINNKSVYARLLKFNSWIVQRSLQKALKKLHIKSPIVINAFNPFFGVNMIGSFQESLFLYYCYDEINAAPWSKKHGKRVEEEFMKKVDLVVTTSEGLQQNKKVYNPNCHLVKNGVDYSLFSQGKALKKYQGQTVVGYVGSIDDRLDYDLLQYCVKRSPHLIFLFVGRIMDESLIVELKKMNNVIFVGSKTPKELPNYIASFDVGIIPFVRNEFTQNIYPLKINEYLAAGIGVVLTPFANLKEFEEITTITDDPNTFLEAILTVSKQQSSNIITQRKEIAQQNSWENRAEQLSQIIHDYQTSKK